MPLRFRQDPDDILAFIRMRLAEDQREHAQRHDPARVLDEVEAKRRILDRHGRLTMGDGTSVCAWCRTQTSEWPCEDVLDLAASYADHDDYRPEWRP